MKITIIPTDKFISIDKISYLNIQEDLSWIPSNIHAVQWHDTWGEIEYTDGTPNEKIEELGIFNQAIDTYNAVIERLAEEEKAIEAARDYWAELRTLRDQKLFDCDWTQIIDVPLTQDQKTSWTTYRQELRDLPLNITDPKPLVNDVNNSQWPIKP